MAYDKEEIKQRLITEIQNRKLVNIEQACVYADISKFTFYNFFPTKSNDYTDIKKELSKNRIVIKEGLMREFYNSKSAVERIFLFKLLANDDELSRVSTNKETQNQEPLTEVTFKVISKKEKQDQDES